MRKAFLLAISAFFLLGFYKEPFMGPSREKGSLEVKGVWLWGSTLYNQGPSRVVKVLKGNNVKDVFLLVKGISGAMTPAATLHSFLSKAHEEGIRVHFWYIVGKDGVFLSSHPDAHVYHCPKPSSGHYDPYPESDESVNLLYPGYKQYVLDNLTYFISNFDIDGVHLDYIRYSHFVYSWDSYHIQKAKSMGCNTERLLNLFRENYEKYAVNEGFVDLYLNGDSDVVKWVSMRKNVIYDYVSSIKNLIQNYRPSLVLSAAFMPEGATDPKWADVYYSQNYSLLSPLLKLISPMAYFKDYGQSPSWVGDVTKRAISLVNSNCKIAAGVQGYGGVSKAELRDEIKYALEAGACGIVVFNYEDMDSNLWAVLRAFYSGNNLFPPDEIEVTRKTDRGLFVARGVNIITWKDNMNFKPVAAYRIYRRKVGKGQAEFIAEVSRGILKYEDYVNHSSHYEYALSSVDANGRESALSKFVKEEKDED